MGPVPDFSPGNWTIDRLELVDDAKLNLTNRFDFQSPYDSRGDHEVLYVKNLVLGARSTLNTAFNRLYYEKLVMDPTAQVVNVPLLGFSLNSISFDDENDYIARVKHNDPDDPTFSPLHVQRVVDMEPDPQGMMRMCTFVDQDARSPQYGLLAHARAKGLLGVALPAASLMQLFQILRMMGCDLHGTVPPVSSRVCHRQTAGATLFSRARKNIS